MGAALRKFWTCIRKQLHLQKEVYGFFVCRVPELFTYLYLARGEARRLQCQRKKYAPLQTTGEYTRNSSATESD